MCLCNRTTNYTVCLYYRIYSEYSISLQLEYTPKIQYTFTIEYTQSTVYASPLLYMKQRKQGAGRGELRDDGKLLQQTVLTVSLMRLQYPSPGYGNKPYFCLRSDRPCRRRQTQPHLDASDGTQLKLLGKTCQPEKKKFYPNNSKNSLKLGHIPPFSRQTQRPAKKKFFFVQKVFLTIRGPFEFFFLLNHRGQNFFKTKNFHTHTLYRFTATVLPRYTPRYTLPNDPLP